MPSPNFAEDESIFNYMLSEAFRMGLDLPPDTDVTTLAFGEHRHWDSLGHLSLIVTLEKTFGVSLGEQDVLEIDSYAAVVTVLKTRVRAGS